ncbi:MULTISPECIES: LLM class flavin-dependent oxidoreductase [unclassified Mycolicibacterium]|uniref:LLM class flavin-dependent oxidoreductase n=1 Tax=unclassified Mycolicibacterium TaxID=2636767 RepID=UPI0012DCFEA8|nr:MULTISPECIES: LLM class flavin-dependent oxidoreductase [unclassified Mycolicibacterium]MUL80812.1 LLM class flavin-dependent oxidoreductase [Mycolicibacterium sp. CBMA 329]MUL86579.1 LLM class flavin-dependent oxidoreductase [Mycolicibacterium sp. CBMA 331]MUM01440.1 LLM class flavin-dependent oxidoreductase [Mycolicibacterium sp. CBMA 334]MUM27244.1 LLM class flavin-dependent oxidoreductase [Mycolicibacterium sp. CBMA 295]MUM36875.1 LLM class flavin-dependent oxidoreductase [Mycolicibacte
MGTPLHLAVALDGTGWHPASWREPLARPADLFSPGYWTDLVSQAERGLLDFVTIEDGLTLQSDHPFRPDDRTDRVRGRLDAVLIAARVAPRTRHIGLVPTVITTHTEPFHASKAIATLDYVSTGRAGVRVQVSSRRDAAAHFGRRRLPEDRATLTDALFGEAGDYVEVLRRLWDSWEDDAEIRDMATGRYIDRAKLHYIDFEGASFSVKGPSITPRPPQGQPIVTALGHVDPAYQLIAGSTDVGFVTPHSADEVTSLVDTIAALRPTDAPPVRVFADLVVFLADTADEARARRDRLDELAGTEYRSDAEIFAGTPGQLADLLQAWHSAGATGFRLRPASLPHDLQQITDALVPDLQRRGLFRESYEASTLRGLLGLTRPANRYTTV